jgi:hypothetical protein
MDDGWGPRRMPRSVRVARVLLYGMAGLAAAFLAALAVAGFQAGEIGALALIPLVFGVSGAVLGWRLGPGRHWVRVTIIVVEAIWSLLSLGVIGEGDPTGYVTLAAAIAVLVLINTRSARGYLARSAVASY